MQQIQIAWALNPQMVEPHEAVPHINHVSYICNEAGRQISEFVSCCKTKKSAVNFLVKCTAQNKDTVNVD